MNRAFGQEGQFLRAFILAIIFNFVIFSSLPFLNRIRARPITVIKKYPISLYQFQVKAQRPELPASVKRSPQPKRIERPKKLETKNEEVRPKGEERPTPAMAPVSVREEKAVPADEADILSSPEALSSHAEGETEVEEEETPLIYDISELDESLQLLKYELPAYPHLAQKTGVLAILVLRLLVNEEGLVEEIKLLESNVASELGFFKEAEKVIKDWRFSKPGINGKGVSVFYVFPLKFVAEN